MTNVSASSSVTMRASTCTRWRLAPRQRPANPKRQPVEVGFVRLMFVAVTVTPLSVLEPLTKTQSLTAIADGATSTVFEIVVFDETSTVVVVALPPNVPVTVSVLPLIDETDPKAKPKLAKLKPPAPPPLVGRLPVPV